MSRVFSTPSASPSDPWWHRWRLPFLLAALAALLYFAAFTYFQVPYYGFIAAWQPDNVLSVVEIPAGRQAGAYLEPGDQVIAIDGVPAHQRLWKPLFVAGKVAYEYTITRDGQYLTFSIPVEKVTRETWLEVVQNRLTISLVALLYWVVGALVLLFATPQNRDAWLLGFVTVSTAVVLAASEAALYNAPGGWLLSSPVFPFLGVVLFRLAFLPRQQPLTRSVERVFHVLYVIAAILALLAAFELLYFNPRNLSFEIVTGFSLYGILLLALALSMVANIIVLLWRFLRMPSSYTRQQILIVLIFTALAIVPGQFLTFYPWLLFNSPVLSWALAVLMLAFIPIGYAFVIYRRRYLQLDIFITSSLSGFLAIVVLAIGYSVAIQVLEASYLVESGSLISGLILVPLLLVVPYTSRPARRAVQTLIYGSRHIYQERLTEFSARLVAQPETDNLQDIFRETLELLQVRQAALMLVDRAGILNAVDEVRVAGIQTIPVRELRLFPDAYPHFQNSGDPSHVHPALANLPWLQVAVPLIASNQRVGLILLGQPIPDGYFNARDIAFLRQLGDTMAVAALNIQLFESSRAMSRKLMQVRDAERLHLASQIHDQPLQRVWFLSGDLENLSEQTDGPIADRLRSHSRELLEIAAQLRSTCSGLYPPIRQQGIQWAIREAVYSFKKQCKDYRVEMDVDLPPEVAVTGEVATAIYHVLLEALNNIGKHTRATQVRIRLYQRMDHLCLLVEDNGKSNNVTFLSVPDLLRGQHYGLAGMHEWAHTINGNLEIRRRVDGGTAVNLTIPPPWQEGPQR